MNDANLPVPVGTDTAVLPPCENCHAPLSGPYCAQCGQRVEPRIHSLPQFAHETFETVTHADSRLWRTLVPLLVKPGHLTAEFLHGRRARYLPPFRLYLVVSLLFFLLVAALSGDSSGLVRTGTASGSDAGAPAETPEARAARLCRLQYAGPAQSYIQPRLEAGCRKMVADGGRGLAGKFLQNIPRAMFFFLPLLALVMKLMYWRPKRYYVEHLLFFIHNHAFAFLFFGLYLLASLVVPQGVAAGALGLGVFAYLLWYFYRSMRRVYGESRRRTLAKFTLLAFTYLVSGGAMLVLTALISVATL